VKIDTILLWGSTFIVVALIAFGFVILISTDDSPARSSTSATTKTSIAPSTLNRDQAEVSVNAAKERAVMERKNAVAEKNNAISASDLVRLYENNEVNADALNKGHLVVIKGTVERIGKDILDDPYVTLGEHDGIRSVQCTFTKADEPQLAKLSPGQTVYVKGIVHGLMMNVQVYVCKLLD
jgi:hypothetical protein